MKEQNINIPHTTKNLQKKCSNQIRPQKVQNHTIIKCKNERNEYIAHEVYEMIKKQLINMQQRRKLEKILQNQPKDIVFAPPKTPIERVKQFRCTQRQKQWQKLKNFKSNNQQRMKRLAQKFKQKSLSQQFRSTSNLSKITKVHRNYEQIQEKNMQKIQQLKKQLLNRSDSVPRPSTNLQRDKRKVMHSSVIFLNKRQNLSTKGGQLTKQQKDIKNCITKLRMIQEHKLQKQLKEQTKRSQKAKIVPKITISTRINKQQQMMNQWNTEYLKRKEKYQKNYNELCKQRDQVIFQRSQQKSQIKQQVLQRKHCNEEKTAQTRKKYLQKKLQKIGSIPNRNKQMKQQIRSRTNFIHNNKKYKEDEQKQQHNEIMRNIYNVIQKLKRLGDSQQLEEKQIALLLENLNYGGLSLNNLYSVNSFDNMTNRNVYNKQKYDCREIIKFITTTRQKFMEQKRKQQEQRNKKSKKNTKIL